jgi:hypothetical protein
MMRDKVRAERSNGERGRRSRAVMWWRGSVVIDKSFVIMVLACAMAPIVGAGLYVVVHLF